MRTSIEKHHMGSRVTLLHLRSDLLHLPRIGTNTAGHVEREGEEGSD